MSSSADTPLPDSAEAISAHDQGMVCFDQGDYDSAVVLFSEAIRLDPTLTNAYFCRGICFYHKSEYDRATTDFSEAIRLDPAIGPTFNWRGSTFIKQQEIDRAIADFTQAIRLDPKYDNAYTNRGVAFQNQGDHDAALADYTQAIRLTPEDARAYRLRGRFCFDLGDHEDALADFREATRLAPFEAEPYVYRGKILQAEGEMEAAEVTYTEAIRLDPQCKEAYLDRGLLRHHNEQFDQAVADFTEAIRITPDESTAYTLRASAWEGLGEDDLAEADIEAATQRKPEEESMRGSKNLVHSLLKAHFDPTPLEELVITERRFPSRVQADLQRALDSLFEHRTVHHFSGVRKQYVHEEVNFTDLLVRDPNDPPLSVAPQYEEIDIGEAERIRCLKSGLWLFEERGARGALFLEPRSPHAHGRGLRFQVATVKSEEGNGITQTFFKHFEETVHQARSYRGKILSLEWEENYSGASTGIKVEWHFHHK